jgi:hypothetical protein
MAITFGSGSGGTGATLSHTVGSGDGRLLVVALHYDGTTPLTATYNSVSMTSVIAQVWSSDGGSSNTLHQIFVLVNPDVGTANVSVSGGSPTRISAVHYFGCKQTAQPGSITNVPTEPASWYVFCGAWKGNTNRSPTMTGVTTRVENGTFGASSAEWIGDSNGSVALDGYTGESWGAVGGTGGNYSTSSGLTIRIDAILVLGTDIVTGMETIAPQTEYSVPILNSVGLSDAETSDVSSQTWRNLAKSSTNWTNQNKS